MRTEVSKSLMSGKKKKMIKTFLPI